MRFFLLFAAVVGLACGATLYQAPKGRNIKPSRPARTLEDDWNDLLALLPIDQILSIFLDHLANDPEVQEAFVYLQSDDFETIIVYIDSQPEFLELLDFAYTHGLTDIYNVINSLHTLLDIPEIPTPDGRRMKRSIVKRTIVSLIDEIAAVIPIDDIVALWNDKLETSTDFQELYAMVSSDEFHDFLLRVEALPETQELFQSLRDLGVDVDAVLDFIRDLFGWNAAGKKIAPKGRNVKPSRPARTLEDDWNDLLALLPIDQILSIFLDHLANDPEVQEAFVYLQSDDFETIIVYIDSQPEFLELLDFAYTHGLTDIYNVINSLHTLLDIPEIPTPDGRRMKRSIVKRTIVSLIDEIAAVIPIDDIVALWNDKLETSTDFQELYAMVSSDEFHDFLLRVEALPETQELFQSLRDLGVDVDAVLDFIRDLFGWNAAGKKNFSRH